MDFSFKAKPIPLNRSRTINNQLKSAKFVDIICHSSTDEDSIASAKAMQWYLRKIKIPARVFHENGDDTFCAKILDKRDLDLLKQKTPQNPSDTVLCVDFSSYTRANPNAYEYLKKTHKLICIDHHKDGDFVNLTNNIYIDTSAKSCTGIITRFFESLKIEVPNKIKKVLYCGMMDDLRKNGYLKFDHTLIPIKTDKLKNDKNTLELYKKYEKELSNKSKNEVMRYLNVLASLSPKEKKFQSNLPQMMKYIPNKKFAYVEIPINDPTWKELGGDNNITSTILNDFRRTCLEKDPNLDTIAVFYPNHNGYRVSAHSQNNNVLNLFNYIQKNINPNLQAGGHADRGGGTNLSFSPEESKKWVADFVLAANNLFK